MAKFYFDVQDGARSVHDMIGMDLENDAQAIQEASWIIEQLAEEASANGRSGKISVQILGERGDSCYEASTSSFDD